MRARSNSRAGPGERRKPSLKGYSILASRYVVSGGEIDLVVRRGDTIAFVEAKARGSLDAAGNRARRQSDGGSAAPLAARPVISAEGFLSLPTAPGAVRLPPVASVSAEGITALRLLLLLIRRLLVVALGVFSVWFIVFVVFRVADHRLPWILALALTYGVAAYVVLPRVVRMSLKIMQRKMVPSFTLTGDGFPGDPVNLALVGAFAELSAAFASAGWTEADPLGFRSSLAMVVAFVLNRPYPAAPFSTLYLFGRGQDVGFQKAIEGTPRKRHHIRFWALSAERVEDTLNTAAFWLNADRPPIGETSLWVGAGTKDTGFSLTKFTFQVTHATDSDADGERDFIIGELKRSGAMGDVIWHQEGERLNLGRVNHYVAGGEIAVAWLA